MDLIRYDKDIKTFKTTEKGLRFLNAYYRIDDAMKIIPSRGLEINRWKGEALH
jgi:hypothetical protein